MNYFKDVDTEDELIEQYRRLLIKYDYKSGRNQKIIEEIEKEYKLVLKRMPIEGKNVPEFVKTISRSMNAAEQKQQAEADRKKALATRSYTKKDLSDYINEKKMFIRRSLIEIIKDGVTYQWMKSNILHNMTDFAIFEGYLSNLKNINDRSWEKGFHDIDEKIEYAVFYLTGRNEKNTETVLRKLDSQMGAYIRSIFPQLEDEYADPILVRQSIKNYHPNIEKMGTEILPKLFGAIFIVTPVLIAAIFVLEFFMQSISDGIYAAMLCTLILLIYFVICVLVKKIWKKNINGRARVRAEEREKKKEYWGNIIVKILRIIKNMI